MWHITFEYSGVAKVGGLGEAVRSMVKALVDYGFRVTVLMPSHGVHLNPYRGFELYPLKFDVQGSRIGVDGARYPYRIGAEKALIDGAEIIVFKGLDTQTGLVFDSRYPYENVEEKAALLARAVAAYAERYGLPDLLHAHDWQSVLAAVAVKDLGERRGLAIPMVYTIHLSSQRSFPWHYASESWAGLKDRFHPVWRVWRHEWTTYSRLWDSVGGCVEFFGILESDVFTTVSWSYMEELLARYGWWLRGKTYVVYNSTDWRVGEVASWLKEKFGTEDRFSVRWRLVEEVEKMCRDRWGWLDKRGPLLIATGRLTYQKGFDVAVKALDYTHEPRLLILGISVGDRGYENHLRELAYSYQGRIEIAVCRLPSPLFKALHYTATAMLVPSRWEPFGIVAVEAMSMGTPVVASNLGGLREIVVDLRVDPDSGTGILVPPDNPMRLAEAIEFIVNAMERNLEARRSIQKNCLERVEANFRIGNVKNALAECYEKARVMAYYRASST